MQGETNSLGVRVLDIAGHDRLHREFGCWLAFLGRTLPSGIHSARIHPPLQLALLFSAETALLKAVAYNIARRCGYLLL